MTQTMMGHEEGGNYTRLGIEELELLANGAGRLVLRDVNHGPVPTERTSPYRLGKIGQATGFLAITKPEFTINPQ